MSHELQPDRDPQAEAGDAQVRGGPGRGRVVLARVLTVLAVILGFARCGTWFVGPARTAARARAAAQPVAASLLWTYGLVAVLMVVLATFLPAFQRSLLVSLVFLGTLVAGVEVVRRIVLADTARALPR